MQQVSGPILRDTARLSQRYPSVAHYGVFGVSTWPIGCDTPSPFSERFPLEEHAKWRCDTPPPPQKRGISAILARYPMKTRQNGCDTHLCDTISNRYCTIGWGGHLALGCWVQQLLKNIERFTVCEAAQDRRYLGGSASLFGITWKVSVAIFVVRASGQA